MFFPCTDKEEIANIISSLSSIKASGPNSITYRILFLLKIEISKQLADLFSLSYMTVFPSALKTAKVIFVLNKDSKFDYTNYCPISQLSNVEKNMKNLLCTKDYIPLSIAGHFRKFSALMWQNARINTARNTMFNVYFPFPEIL